MFHMRDSRGLLIASGSEIEDLIEKAKEQTRQRRMIGDFAIWDDKDTCIGVVQNLGNTGVKWLPVQQVQVYEGTCWKCKRTSTGSSPQNICPKCGSDAMEWAL
jgi:rRNA maturation endonuclease Nob1